MSKTLKDAIADNVGTEDALDTVNNILHRLASRLRTASLQAQTPWLRTELTEVGLELENLSWLISDEAVGRVAPANPK